MDPTILYHMLVYDRLMTRDLPKANPVLCSLSFLMHAFFYKKVVYKKVVLDRSKIMKNCEKL